VTAASPRATARQATTGPASGSAPAPLTEPSTSDGTDLPVPDEPGDLKVALRAAILDGQPWGEQPNALDLSGWLWGVWGEALQSLGFGRDRFDEVLDASEREARLWLLGDRQWAQFVSGLIGRISRRLPATPTA
jgi:hypothetical protein